jgi:hypothetical protein
LVEIDDVNTVALTENESLHLWVPTAGLMSKMHASIKQLAHGYDGGTGVHVNIPPGKRSADSWL